MRGLLGVLLRRRGVVSSTDVAQIDAVNGIFLPQGLEEVCLAEQVRGELDAPDVLALPDGAAEEEELLGLGLFQFAEGVH